MASNSDLYAWVNELNNFQLVNELKKRGFTAVGVFAAKRNRLLKFLRDQNNLENVRTFHGSNDLISSDESSRQIDHSVIPKFRDSESFSSMNSFHGFDLQSTNPVHRNLIEIGEPSNCHDNSTTPYFRNLNSLSSESTNSNFNSGINNDNRENLNLHQRS